MSSAGPRTSLGGTINPYYRSPKRVIDGKDPVDHDIGNVARHHGATPAPPLRSQFDDARAPERFGSSVEFGNAVAPGYGAFGDAGSSVGSGFGNSVGVRYAHATASSAPVGPGFGNANPGSTNEAKK